MTLKHLVLDAKEGSDHAIHIDLTHDIRTVLDSDSNNQVVLRAQGSADWHLSGWIGLPQTIPALQSGAASSGGPKRRSAAVWTGGQVGTVQIEGEGHRECCVM